MIKKIVFALATLVFISCKNEAPVTYALFSGNVTNKLGNELTVQGDKSFKKVIKLNEDGSFSDTLRITPGKFVFHDGKTAVKLYLQHGDQLQVTIDATDFLNTVSFMGVGAEVNNYLIAKAKEDKKINLPTKELFRLEESSFKTKNQEVKLALETLLDGTSGLSDDFKAGEKRDIFYNYALKLNNYKSYHAYYAKKENFETSENFLDDLKEFEMDNEADFKNSDDYKRLVTNHYRELAEKMAEKDSIEHDLSYLKVVAKNSSSNFIKNELLYDAARYGVTYAEDIEGYYNEYMATATNEDYRKEITKSYDKLKTVAKGQPSPKFVNYENYKGGTTSLDELKGKLVYVDVWATWCGPCKREIPYLKEVEKAYHNQNIEFVSISVDKAKDHNKWREMVAEKELSGIQLFADKDWKSGFVEGYLIKGIPRFILIDSEGNIISSNAPRPSNPKLKELLNRELGI